MNRINSEEGILEDVIKLRGLPWSCTVDDIIEFLGSGCQTLNDAEGIHLVQTPEGRSTGEAFVEVASGVDMRIALENDHKSMGHRYIEVFKVKRAEMEWILKRARPQSPRGTKRMRSNERDYGKDADSYLRLRGIPFECTEEDIYEFFRGLEIVENGIQIVIDGSGRPSGEAYAQFASPLLAQEGLKRDRKSIGHRYVELFRVGAHEIRLIKMLVDKESRYGLPRPTPYDRPMDRGRSMGSRYNRHENSGGGGGYYERERSSYGNGRAEGRGRLLQPPPPPSLPSRYASSSNSFRRGRGGGEDGGEGAVWGQETEYSLLMRGLPFKATEEDIREFFEPLDPVGVHIIYNDENRPSGTARAFFMSDRDVNMAMRKDKDSMQHRYIELFRD